MAFRSEAMVALSTYIVVAILYVIFWNISSYHYVHIVNSFIERKNYRLESYRPFISIWDGLRPPFFTWLWKVFRVTAWDTKGLKLEGWLRCDKFKVVALWDSGKIETVTSEEIADRHTSLG
jgi:hypothetical protein